MSFSAAIVAWEALKNQRDSGNDPVLEVKQVKLETKAFLINKLLQQIGGIQLIPD
ncbi:hypothetical protein MTYM_00143 [Methylococcales bacterium]|nr:hypothetical protein MTYM_00143 [Methylococcales bacterium]